MLKRHSGFRMTLPRQTPWPTLTKILGETQGSSVKMGEFVLFKHSEIFQLNSYQPNVKIIPAPNTQMPSVAVPSVSDTHSSTAFLGRSGGISVTSLSWQRKTLLEQRQIRWWHPEPKLRKASKETRIKAMLIYPSTCFPPAFAEKNLYRFQRLHSAPLWDLPPGSHDPRDAFFFVTPGE